MRRMYRSTTIELGPHATAHDAATAILTECREQGYTPKPDTVHAEAIYPTVTATVVRYHPRKGPSRIVDVDPEDVVGIFMRWNHSVHEEVVATRWTGYVEVVNEEACPVCEDDETIAGCGACRRGMAALPTARPVR